MEEGKGRGGKSNHKKPQKVSHAESDNRCWGTYRTHYTGFSLNTNSNVKELKRGFKTESSIFFSNSK